MNSRPLVLTGLCLAGALLTGTAMARGNDDVQWSVTVGGGAPVHVRPAPVYVQPGYPVYQPAPVYPVYPAYQGYQGYQVYQGYPAGRHGGYYRQPSRWDRDGDGVPNRYDRVYNPAWDRDGDGVPNRHDRHPDRPGGWGR